jgi:hypothetical protein
MSVERIGPSPEVIAENKRLDNLARVKLEAQRRMTEAEQAGAIAQAQAAQAAIVTEQLRLSALLSWTANGGTQAEFETAWPQLRLQLLQQKALEAQATEKNEIERRTAEYGGRF